MKITLKTEAIKLRKTGASYGEIKKKLNISKSTLSYWLKDVPLTEKQKNGFIQIVWRFWLGGLKVKKKEGKGK